MRRVIVATIVVLLLAGLATGSGCRRVRIEDQPENRVQTDTRREPLGGAESVRAEIRMAVGELTVSSDASSTDVLNGRFTYSPEAWRPEVSYRLSDGVGRLEISQPERIAVRPFRSSRNDWDLTLGGGVPMDLSFKLGAGDNRLDLRGLAVRDLEVIMGVGNTVIDLTGPRAADVSARVEAGVGRVEVRLPKDVAVKVTGREDGVGSYSADGFIAEGDSWVNDAWGKPGPRIEVRLMRGVGDVVLVLAD